MNAGAVIALILCALLVLIGIALIARPEPAARMQTRLLETQLRWMEGRRGRMQMRLVGLFILLATGGVLIAVLAGGTR